MAKVITRVFKHVFKKTRRTKNKEKQRKTWMILLGNSSLSLSRILRTMF